MAAVKILIVEDELLIAESLAAKLENLGYEVVDTVVSGEAAIQAFREWEPDLALLDIDLEGPMDGIEVAEAIHQLRPVPFIYLSDLSDRVTTKRAKYTGPAAYMVKPYNERELAVAIELALHKFSSGGEEEPE